MKIATHDLGREPNEFICWNLVNVWPSVDEKTNSTSVCGWYQKQLKSSTPWLYLEKSDPKEFRLDNLSLIPKEI